MFNQLHLILSILLCLKILDYLFKLNRGSPKSCLSISISFLYFHHYILKKILLISKVFHLNLTPLSFPSLLSPFSTGEQPDFARDQLSYFNYFGFLSYLTDHRCLWPSSGASPHHCWVLPLIGNQPELHQPGQKEKGGEACSLKEGERAISFPSYFIVFSSLFFYFFIFFFFSHRMGSIHCNLLESLRPVSKLCSISYFQKLKRKLR